MSRRPRALDVAIIGMACRFPGAPDLFAYWENLLAGHVAIRDVPSSRWDAATFFDPDSSESDRVGGRRGGYLDEPIPFDSAALGIMPRTVEGGEPEQFLVLDAARAALADAGMPDGVKDGHKVDVIVGRGNYFNRGNLTRLQHGRVLAQTLGLLRALHPDWTETDIQAVRADLKATLPPFESATIPGQLTNATAGRVSAGLNLRGACYVVDAASASSLVALELGARTLAERKADLAIVGGVYIEADVDFPMVFSRLGLLSRSGEMRPFAADASGLVPGEGVGVVVLKRLADAERNRDRVYAVIQGIGLASNGRGPGLAALDARGHLRAIRRAYRQSGIDPSTVGLVEGNGLGIPAADRAELKALQAAFPLEATGARCILGTASSLIGHAMPAAGMAGLVKAALALHHRALPVSVGADNPHPLLSRAGSSLTLNPQSRPWIHGVSTPRRAGVNAFGFAGINAHVILDEHTPSADGPTPGALVRWPDEAVLLTAPDRQGLVDRARALAHQLRRRPDVALKDVAYTLNTAAVTPRLPARLGLVVASVPELIERLDAVALRLANPACQSMRDGRGAYYWQEPLGLSGRLAFLFPGEGSQYPGMLADLCLHFPEVRALFDASDRLALESGSIEPPSDRLFGASAGADPALWSPTTAVNIVLSSQWALYGLLRSLGLDPDAVAGHSSGEFLALAAAGTVRVDRRLEIGFNQLAAVFGQLESSGNLPQARLVVVAADRETVRSAIGAHADQVSIAVDNCPHQVVIVGPDRPVDAVVARLQAAGVSCENLPFGRPYHSPSFAAVIEPVRAFFQTLGIQRPQIPLYSCCLGGRVPDDPEAIRRLAVEQWTRTVEFRRTIEAMHADGLRLFIDVGARGNLAGFVEDTLRGRPALAVAANLPRRSGLTQINHLVASLFAQGLSLEPGFLYARRRPVRLDLDDPPPIRHRGVELKLGFPEMRLSEDLAHRLKSEQSLHVSETSPGVDHLADGFQPRTNLRELTGIPNFSRISSAGLQAVASSTSQVNLSTSARDEGMLAFLDTMNSFLETERGITVAALEAREEQKPAPSRFVTDRKHAGDGRKPIAMVSTGCKAGPGPWAGDVRSLVEGRELVATITLDASKDPIAEHHTFGGRRISAVDPNLKGLPVLPFAVMAEMLAESAARLRPGSMLVGLRAIRARRWIRYEATPIVLEIRARVDSEHPGEVRATLHNRGPLNDPRSSDDEPDVEGIVVFAPARLEPPVATPLCLGAAEPSRFTAETMYAEQWLFHGPPLQAVVKVGSVSPRGIEGTLRVLPPRALMRDPESPRPLTDPIVLDAFTHLLGLWGLDCLSEGDVIFPLRMGMLEIFGEDALEGVDVDCRIAVRSLERNRVKVEAEIVRPDGRVWMRIRDWEDWRFYWPTRYRDVFRQPDRILLGEPLPLPAGTRGVAVWLEPPADMGRPIWRDVLEQVQLSPEERARFLDLHGAEDRRTARLWGRIAAKDAVRRLWLAEGHGAVYPADLTILPDERGRPLLHSRLQPSRQDLPAVSIAHAEGVAVALAGCSSRSRVGIDVERIVARDSSFESLAFSPAERAHLETVDPKDRSAWVARMWSAKEAAAKATGLGLAAGPATVAIRQVDLETGKIAIVLDTELARTCIDTSAASFEVNTAVRGEYAWAWTLMEPHDQ